MYGLNYGKKLKKIKKIKGKGCGNCLNRRTILYCELSRKENNRIPDDVFYRKGCKHKKKGAVYF